MNPKNFYITQHCEFFRILTKTNLTSKKYLLEDMYTIVYRTPFLLLVPYKNKHANASQKSYFQFHSNTPITKVHVSFLSTYHWHHSYHTLIHNLETFRWRPRIPTVICRKKRCIEIVWHIAYVLMYHLRWGGTARSFVLYILITTWKVVNLIVSFHISYTVDSAIRIQFSSFVWYIFFFTIGYSVLNNVKKIKWCLHGVYEMVLDLSGL